MTEHGKLCPVVNGRVELGCACRLIHARERCHVTGNPCGTDTWQLGYVCPCPECTKYMAGRARTWPTVSDPNEGLRGPTQLKSEGKDP